MSNVQGPARGRAPTTVQSRVNRACSAVDGTFRSGQRLTCITMTLRGLHDRAQYRQRLGAESIETCMLTTVASGQLRIARAAGMSLCNNSSRFGPTSTLIWVAR
jgi:hypothetical protein